MDTGVSHAHQRVLRKADYVLPYLLSLVGLFGSCRRLLAFGHSSYLYFLCVSGLVTHYTYAHDQRNLRKDALCSTRSDRINNNNNISFVSLVPIEFTPVI